MKKILTSLSALFLMIMLSANALAHVEQTVEDAAITTEVKTLLFEKKLVNNENFNPMHVHVETTQGIVKLSGHVRNDAEKTRATEIVQTAKGVKSVDNQLAIQ